MRTYKRKIALLLVSYCVSRSASENMLIRATISAVALVLLCWASLARGGRISYSNAHLCMMNCGQCKEMYGDYFNGRLCAQSCLDGFTSDRGLTPDMPDCNDPGSFKDFLKSSSEVISRPPVAQALKSGKLYYSGHHPNNVYKPSSSRDSSSWKKRIIDTGIVPRWYFV